MGGSIAAIESGWMQARIADSAYAAQQAIERGEQVVVGVNRFAEVQTGAPIALQQIDERAEREQVERLRALRASRDSDSVTRTLAAVRDAAVGTRNLMPPFVDAADAGATLGEICNVFAMFSVRTEPKRSSRSGPFDYGATRSLRMTTVEIDHIAIVVKDLDATLLLYTQTLGFRQVYREIVNDQGVEALGLEAGGSFVELLLPLDEASPIARFRGDAPTKLHHTAYRVADIETTLAVLKAKGVRLIDEHARKGAHGNLIAFLHPKATDGVLIELCQPTR